MMQTEAQSNLAVHDLYDARIMELSFLSNQYRLEGVTKLVNRTSCYIVRKLLSNCPKQQNKKLCDDIKESRFYAVSEDRLIRRYKEIRTKILKFYASKSGDP
jgi:hypothetical protein